MPSYNQGRFIRESIDSVLDQGYPNKELIVIDGGSTDDTIDILKSYGERIAYWVSEPDKGQSDALNKGFKIATGDLLGWMNSDDLYEHGSFSKIVDAFSKNPDKYVVFGDHWEIDKNGNKIIFQPAFNFNLRHFVYEGFTCNSQSMLWRRDLMDKFGQFDVKLHRTMDYDLLVRFGKIVGNKGFKRIPHTIGLFRRHESQKTRAHGHRRIKGLEEPVFLEHKYIAEKNGFSRKYSAMGPFLRFIFRIRRACWYARRGVLLDNIKKKLRI